MEEKKKNKREKEKRLLFPMNKEEMFLAIFLWFCSICYFSVCILEFQFSNIPYFVVFDSFREEKRSQNEPGHLIGGQTAK